MNYVRFWLFPDGTVVPEDEWYTGNTDYQYIDDFEEISIPEEIVDYIKEYM